MRKEVIIVGIFTIVSVTGCGSGSVEHEYYESPEFSGQRTRIHVRSHDEPSDGYRIVDGRPIHIHVHGGRSVCIEITTD